MRTASPAALYSVFCCDPPAEVVVSGRPAGVTPPPAAGVVAVVYVVVIVRPLRWPGTGGEVTLVRLPAVSYVSDVFASALRFSDEGGVVTSISWSLRGSGVSVAGAGSGQYL